MDERFIALGALTALARNGEIDSDVVVQAMKYFGIDQDKADAATS